MNKGNIIFLNGTSSAGKTTLTRKIQETMSEPYFHLSLDTYESMAPEQYLEDDFWKTLNISATAMHHSIAVFSDLGINTIVDTVILDIPEEKNWIPDCARILSDYPALFVGIHCPLEELERREKKRGDRDIGQAKWQLERIHGHKIYDLEINTYENTMDECVAHIKSKMVNIYNEITAFQRLNKIYSELKL